MAIGIKLKDKWVTICKKLGITPRPKKTNILHYTLEKNIGKWLDGKPIHRIHIFFDLPLIDYYRINDNFIYTVLRYFNLNNCIILNQNLNVIVNTVNIAKTMYDKHPIMPKSNDPTYVFKNIGNIYQYFASIYTENKITIDRTSSNPAKYCVEAPLVFTKVGCGHTYVPYRESRPELFRLCDLEYANINGIYVNLEFVSYTKEQFYNDKFKHFFYFD